MADGIFNEVNCCSRDWNVSPFLNTYTSVYVLFPQPGDGSDLLVFCVHLLFGRPTDFTGEFHRSTPQESQLLVDLHPPLVAYSGV